MGSLAKVCIPLQNSSNTTVLKRGDTIPEILFSFLDTDDIDLIGSTIRMELYLGSSKKWTVENDNGITIIDSKNFRIDEVSYENNTLPVGLLEGDLEITDVYGTRLTYFDISYEITKDYTV